MYMYVCAIYDSSQYVLYDVIYKIKWNSEL